LRHLSLPLQCHQHIFALPRNAPTWTRDKLVLDIVLRNIHAVGIHPFAAFLTTTNLTFLLLPLFANVRTYNPTFVLDLQVYCADSLEKPEEQSLTPEMFVELNSRIQQSAESAERYRGLQGMRFHYIVGNPPWGGVLKGPLAPVYTDSKKRRFAGEYPNAAVGKYDVYGLFIERSTQLLANGGLFGMVTQDTYLDKEWAKKLRRLLGSSARMEAIVDLNPFGQLFFKAMNTPVVTVFEQSDARTGTFVAVASERPKFGRGDNASRRATVVSTVGEAIGRAKTKGSGQASVGFATAWWKSRRSLLQDADRGWDLRPVRSGAKFRGDTIRASELLEPRQGVTPGGALDLFLMSEEQAKSLGLEEGLLHRAIKTKETRRWRAGWQGRVILYPYAVRSGEFKPAFALAGTNDGDALDFEHPLDERERDIRRTVGSSSLVAKQLLEHRISLGIVDFPQVARYLVGSYARLESRIFKKKRMEAFGRKWYEYLWPRDAELMLSKPRIISPTLVREVRFSLDTDGWLSDHSCLYLLPTQATAGRRADLRQRLEQVGGQTISDVELMQYCLAFLNSSVAQETLLRRRPTAKGSYAINEQYISDVDIPLIGDAALLKDLMELTKALTESESVRAAAPMEVRLGRLVASLLGARGR